MFVLILSALLSLVPAPVAPASPVSTTPIQATATAAEPTPTLAPNDQPVAHP